MPGDPDDDLLDDVRAQARDLGVRSRVYGQDALVVDRVLARTTQLRNERERARRHRRRMAGGVTASLVVAILLLTWQIGGDHSPSPVAGTRVSPSTSISAAPSPSSVPSASGAVPAPLAPVARGLTRLIDESTLIVRARPIDGGRYIVVEVLAGPTRAGEVLATGDHRAWTGEVLLFLDSSRRVLAAYPRQSTSRYGGSASITRDGVSRVSREVLEALIARS